MMVACGLSAAVPALPAALHTLAGSAASQLHLLRRPTKDAAQSAQVDKLSRKAWLGTLSMQRLRASATYMQDGSAAEHFAVVRAEFGPRASDPLEHTRQLWSREEERWLREEQRWLREEQRWERERSRMEAQEAQQQQNEALLLAQVIELRAELAAAKAQLALSSSAPTTAPSALPSPSVLANSPTKQLVVGSASTNSSNVSSKPPSASQSSLAKSSSSHSTPSASAKAAVGNAAGATVSTSRAAASASPSAASPKPPAPRASSSQTGAATSAAGQKRPTLRKGADGDLVQELQIRLEELGFYSGEEEMEFFMFSTQTEDAVMSFQASVQLKEDGIVGPNTWSRLFPIQDAKADTTMSTASSKPPTAKRTSAAGTQASGKPTTPSPMFSGSNGVTTSANTTHQPSAKATVARPESDRYATTKAEGNLQERRVYLLGENRWEEPDRLITFNTTGELRPVRAKACHTCQGPGVVVCSECEGTGQMNVEEQFLEWVDEGEQHCPYCAGVGSNTCDACEGTGVDK